MPWPRLAALWPSLKAAARRELVGTAARGLRAAWQAAGDLRAVPASALGFVLIEGTAREARLPASLTPALSGPLTPPQLRGVLAGWFNEVRADLHPAEALLFLRRFLPDLTDDQLHYQARAIRALADHRLRQRAGDLYQGQLGETRSSADDHLTGRWKPDLDVRPADLFAALQAAEGGPDSHRIKSGAAITVTRALLWGHDVIIKRYELPGGWRSWKYRGRASRARRAWAAGQTLSALGIPTPEPLGFLEVHKGKLPSTSYVITRFAARAESAFRWVRHSYQRMDDLERRRARNELRRALCQLYDVGLYHGDTKLTNLLVETVPSGQARTWLWTDLECVDAGHALTHRRLLRNLVQINGSLRHWVSDSDRLAFLRALAMAYPWLARPRVAALIRRRTQRRLRRELTGRTPPDGRPAS